MSSEIPTDVAAARTQLIELAAGKYGLPPSVVLAVCRTESGLDRWAMRFEPDYRWLWNVRTGQGYKVRPTDMSLDRAPADFPASAGLSPHTEWIGQHTSYGVMQVMGSLAREMGFKGFFTQLCDVPTCLDVGCRHLIELRDKHFAHFGWRGVYAAYNSGSPEGDAEYSDRVIKNGGPQ